MPRTPSKSFIDINNMAQQHSHRNSHIGNHDDIDYANQNNNNNDNNVVWPAIPRELSSTTSAPQPHTSNHNQSVFARSKKTPKAPSDRDDEQDDARRPGVGQEERERGHMKRKSSPVKAVLSKERDAGNAHEREEVGRRENYEQSAADTNKEFERLMDELQIPSSVRLKVSPLDTPMKHSLLVSFRAQAAAQRGSAGSGAGFGSSYQPSSQQRPSGQGRAMSSHPTSGMGLGMMLPPATPTGMKITGEGSERQILEYSTPGRRGGGGGGGEDGHDQHGNGVGNGNGRHIRKTQSTSSLGSPSGSPHNANNTGGNSKTNTRIIENSKFIMMATNTLHTSSTSTASSAKPSHRSAGPQAPPMMKRYTADGIQLPPVLPGDEDLYSEEQDDRSTNPGSKKGSKSKSRVRGFSFSGDSFGRGGGGWAGSNSSSTTAAVGTGGGGGKRSSWFGSRSKEKDDQTNSAHIEGTPFALPSSSSSSIVGTGSTANGNRPRTKSRAGETMTRQGGGKMTPAQWADWLKREDTFKMGVEKVKVLRMLLRHETTEWVEVFLASGGYECLLARLYDLLDVEWRTEQHDDKLLHEILRCIKALSTLEAGKQALVAHKAAPFRQLADLLYSDKKPGDLASRQVIIELFHSVLSLRPASSELSNSSSTATETSEISDSKTPVLRNRASCVNMQPVKIEDTSARVTALVLDLLRSSADKEAMEAIKAEKVRKRLPFLEPATELPAPKLEVHDFLAKAHVERPYKTYLRELSDVCRDYYWIMCHGENNIWLLSEVDRSTVKPQAPSGATGGVEFEAVFYMTSHFRLLNSLAKALAQQDMLDSEVRADRRKGIAWNLHTDMFASGMDRILATVRKASVDFYTDFHMELAIYVQLARDTGIKLPYVVDKLIGPPAEKYRKFDAFAGQAQDDGSRAGVGAGAAREWLPPPRSSSAFKLPSLQAA